jgi:hypothetical protein
MVFPAAWDIGLSRASHDPRFVLRGLGWLIGGAWKGEVRRSATRIDNPSKPWAEAPRLPSWCRSATPEKWPNSRAVRRGWRDHAFGVGIGIGIGIEREYRGYPVQEEAGDHRVSGNDADSDSDPDPDSEQDHTDAGPCGEGGARGGSRSVVTLEDTQNTTRRGGMLRSWWNGGAAPLGLKILFGVRGSTDMTALWAYRHGGPMGLPT